MSFVTLSVAVSQENQKNLGPHPPDLSCQWRISRPSGCATSEGQHYEPCVGSLKSEA